MSDLQTAQPASDTSAGGQTASASSENLDDALSRVYDEMQKPASEPAADIAEAKDAPAESTEAAAETPPDAATTTPEVRPPHAWAAEYKGSFGQIPQKLQQYIAQRETEAQRQITKHGMAVREYEPLRQTFDEYRQSVPRGKEAEVTRNLLQAQAYIDRDPVAGIAELARVYGINPNQLAQRLGLQAQQQQTRDPSQDAVDDLFRDSRLDKEVMPVVQTLKAQNEALQRELYEIKNGLQRRESTELSQRQRAVEGTINEFARDKSDWNEVAEEVVAEVAVLKQRNPGADPKSLLEQAYDRARWKIPEIRDRIQTDQRKAEEAKALKTAAEDAAKAKKLASMNVRSGASASTGTFDGKWDDADKLSALFDRVTSR